MPSLHSLADVIIDHNKWRRAGASDLPRPSHPTLFNVLKEGRICMCFWILARIKERWEGVRCFADTARGNRFWAGGVL